MKFISPKVIPPRSPLLSTAVWVTFLSYWGAPGWLWGVMGTVIVINWVVFFLAAFVYTYVPEDPEDRLHSFRGEPTMPHPHEKKSSSEEKGS